MNVTERLAEIQAAVADLPHRIAEAINAAIEEGKQ